MSTSGISSSLSQLETMMNSAQQFLSDFKQLGTDLQSGNLTAAQQDFVTLSKDAQASSATSSTSSTSSSSSQSSQSALTTDFQTLSKDLQSGDLSGAQQAYTQLAKDLQSSSSSSSSADSSSSSSVLAQLLQVLLGTSTSTSSTSSSSTASDASTSSTSASDSSSSTGTSSTSTSSTSGSSDALSTLMQEFESVGAALQSGDLAGAQLAFAQFTAEAQSAASTVNSNGAQVHHSAEGSGASAGAQLLQAFLSSQSTDSTASSTALVSGSTVNVSA